MKKSKTIIYVDMDFTLCDYAEGFTRHQLLYPDLEYPQSQPGLYRNLNPMPGAIDAYRWLHRQSIFEVYILTSPSTKNPHCYSEKRIWVEEYLGMDIVEHLIITPNKGLNKGHFLIDDNIEGKGQEAFEGELIQFGSIRYPDWISVQRYFENLTL